jgi:hypothetical protein
LGAKAQCSTLGSNFERGGRTDEQRRDVRVLRTVLTHRRFVIHERPRLIGVEDSADNPSDHHSYQKRVKLEEIIDGVYEETEEAQSPDESETTLALASGLELRRTIQGHAFSGRIIADVEMCHETHNYHVLTSLREPEQHKNSTRMTPRARR